MMISIMAKTLKIYQNLKYKINFKIKLIPIITHQLLQIELLILTLSLYIQTPLES